jgi:hypothetical protein
VRGPDDVHRALEVVGLDTVLEIVARPPGIERPAAE